MFWAVLLVITGVSGGLLAIVGGLNYWRMWRRINEARTELAGAERQVRIERSERAAVEKEREREKQWAEILFNSSRDLVFIYGVSPAGLPGPFIQVNNIACEVLGHSRERLLTMTPLDIEDAPVPTSMLGYTRTELAVMTDEEIKDRQNVTSTARHLMARILADGHAVYERVYVTRTGQRFPVEIDARRLDLYDRPTILCTAHDITERRRVQQALRESEQRFLDFFAHSPIGVAMYNSNRELLNVNLACLRMFGSPGMAEFSRLNVFDNPYLSPETRQTLDRGQNASYEAVIDFDAVRQNGLFVTSRSGKAYMAVTIHNMGLDVEFRPKGFLAQVQDVTRRREAELALIQSERQLRQAQKLEAIGTLAGGIAHDFNNILTPIMGYTEMVLHMGLKGGGEALDFLGEVLKASHRAKDLVNQILTFSRQSDKEGHPIQISPIVKEVVKQLRATLPENVEIVQILKASRDVVVADPTQIHQVLMNLCTNAAHAMRERGGTLEVRLGEFVQQERGGGNLPQLAPGRYLRLSVKDTGMGMSQTTMERIFEPFFTTKPSGEGTGMGLAVVHGIVSSLKGSVTVESQLGSGTVFHVALPAAERLQSREDEAAAPLPGGSACVLFVDDEPDIVSMETRMLTSLGYRPVVATGGEEALSLFSANPGQFDLVITDEVMPGMSGSEMAAAMLAIRPELPIVLCTGFSEAVSPQQVKAAGMRELLLKPVSMRTLAETIQRLLSSGKLQSEPCAENQR